MIIILEGCNGVGKSEYARRLSDALHAPICRPFRNGDTDTHWDSGNVDFQDWLRDARVPVNTHVDDLYVADFLNNFQHVDAVLDRSLPSAIAYGKVLDLLDGFYQNKIVCQSLYEFWEGLIGKRDDVMMVLLNCMYEDAKKRCSDRQFPNKGTWTKLETQFMKLFRRCKLPKKQINTSFVKPEDGVLTIMRALDG